MTNAVNIAHAYDMFMIISEVLYCMHVSVNYYACLNVIPHCTKSSYTVIVYILTDFIAYWKFE